MKAIILAGGFGTRLRPLTLAYPKPMIPLVNRPALAHVLNLLKHHHFSEVVITVQYMAEQIQEYFGDGSHLGMSIHYVVEETPLGTAGSVKNAQPYLDDDSFLIISSDVITDIDLEHLVRFHHRRQSKATLALMQIDDPLEYGVVVTDHRGRIKEYIEKPGLKEVVSYMINTGIYVLEPEVLVTMDPDVVYDFSDDVFPQLLSRNEAIFGCVVDGYWRDVGTLEDYMQASADVLTGKVNQIEMGHHLGSNVWAGRDIELASNVALHGPVYLGHRVKVKSGAAIYGPAVISNNTIIDRNAVIAQSIIGEDCFLGESTMVRRCIIAKQRRLATRLEVADTVII